MGSDATTKPVLPEPALVMPGLGKHGMRYYTAEQMRAYGQACAEAEREANAQLCEQIAVEHLSSGRYVSVIADLSVRAGGKGDGASECAAAIRSRK